MVMTDEEQRAERAQPRDLAGQLGTWVCDMEVWVARGTAYDES